MKTYLYGASDDLIEIDGEISEEINYYSEKPLPFEASDGTKGTIQYNGNWLISVSPIGPNVVLWQPPVGEDIKHNQELDKIGVPGYSSCLIFDDIDWIKIGRKKLKRN